MVDDENTGVADFLGTLKNILKSTRAGNDSTNDIIINPYEFIYLVKALAPIEILRPIFFFLSQTPTDQVLTILPRITEELRDLPSDESVDYIIQIPHIDTQTADERQTVLRSSIWKHLFGWDDLLSLRMRLSIADICWVR